MNNLKETWCSWFHGGGFVARDCYDRVNWRCVTCGRWSTPVDPQTEKIMADGMIKEFKK